MKTYTWSSKNELFEKKKNEKIVKGKKNHEAAQIQLSISHFILKVAKAIWETSHHV